MNIYICDDDKDFCDYLKTVLQNHKDNITKDIFCFNDSESLLIGIEKQTPDILFMDIELHKENGIETIKEIRKTHFSIIVVYISAYPQYVFSSFDTEPLTFLTKPVDEKELYKTFDRVLKKYQDIHQEIIVKWHHTPIKIQINNICYVEGYNRHLVFHMYNKEVIEVVGKLEKVFHELQPHGFTQSHQGFIVNMMYIKSFGNDEIFMDNGDIVLMSVRKKLSTKETYYKYLMRG